MAYDPKSYLDKALKTGFAPQYSQPASLETGEAPQYQGDLATFGDVLVRPTSELVGQTEQDIGTSRQTGYAVDVPITTGKYKGWNRTDSYDLNGNFLGTSYNPPDNDKWGLKGLAQFGLTAASFGGLGSLGKLITQGVRGINAIKSGDPLKILSAASGVTGTNFLPSEVSDVLKYAGQAGQVNNALKGDPNAIFGLITGAASGKIPVGKLVDTTGSDIIEGFNDPGGEGYIDPSAGDLPSWALDPYGTTSDAYYDSDPTQEKYAEEDRLLGKYPAPASIIDPKTSMSPQEMSRFLEANIDDPVIIDSVMQEYFPDLYMQSINVTGTIPNQGDITAPRSIRDIGTVTTISPDEKLEGTTIQEPDLSVGLPVAAAPAPAPRSPAPAPRAPAPAPRSPAPSSAGSGLDLSALFALMGAMANQQQPTRTATGTSLARGTPESPFGLMYKLRG